MCGIVGFCGNDSANALVLSGLKRLEYRGYDSWGIASQNGSGLNVVKQVGKISEAKIEFKSSNISVGQTRWSTHGGVTIENAHPHVSCDGNISIVHNGIIENYVDLKHKLVKSGHVFKSETDSEVIVHLIEEFSKGFEFEEAVRRTALALEGSFAVLVLNSKYDKIVALCRGSPLVVGKASEGVFLASDVSGFLEHTRDVMFLPEESIVVADKDNVVVKNFSGHKVASEFSRVDWDLEDAAKGAYPHFMLKEIFEQPSTITAAVSHSDEFFKELADEVENAFGVLFVACGTSYHACKSAEYVFSKIARAHVNTYLASEFEHFQHFLKPNTLVVAVSQSGETADLIDAVKVAKAQGSRVISIVNVIGSTLMRLSDKSILMNCGPEIGVASTKAYTSQLAILTMLAYVRAGKLNLGRNSFREVQRALNFILSGAQVEKIKGLARFLKNANSLFAIGRGVHYPSAMEAALKVKEISYIHAEAFAGGELKHGTLALIEDNVPCLVFTGENGDKQKIISNAMEIKSRGGFMIGIGPENDPVFDVFIEVPEVIGASHILEIVPTQLLAYYLAVERNCDPDKPRNLAKVITVR